MTVTYNGLDCLADQNLPEYTLYGDQSQQAINYYTLPNYGYDTLYYGAATIVVVVLKYLFTYYRDRRLAAGASKNGLCGSIFDVAAAYCRLFGYRPTPRWLMTWFSFPKSIGQSLYAVVTALYLLCLCLVPHFWYRGCKGFGSPPLAIRAGLMAIAVVPFIFLLSGKYNFAGYFTGMGYEKLNWLHQFLGLACFVLALIHMIPFLVQPVREGGMANLADVFSTDSDYQHGTMAMVFLFLLVSMFNRHIRKAVYEVSFHFHWIMGCAFFAFLMNHVYGMLNAQNYLWATLAVWMTQWIYKVFKSGMTSVREAEIERFGDHAMQVSVFSVKGYSWSPGQHCFLRFPGVRIFDNHPFSIASVVEDDYMKFIVVPKRGLTRKLHEQLNEQIQKKKVYVDGPYGGCPRNPLAFDKVFLLCTGSGITATLPFLTLLAAAKAGPDVHLIWAVRHLEDVELVRLEIENSLNQEGRNIRVVVYVCNEPSESEKKTPVCGASIIFTKPDFTNVVSAMGLDLGSRNMFVSSGSHSMSRSVAQAVAGLQVCVLLNDQSRVREVYLHSETFGW